MAANVEMEDNFKKLIESGEAFRQDFLNGYRYRWYRYSALNADYSRWKKECLQLVKRAWGPQSRYYTELAAVESDYASRAPGSVFSFFLNTLKTAYGDLQSVPAPAASRATRAAGLTEDFLVRAEGMVGKGHYISAATLAGAVLEDVLRRLAEVRGVFCPENATLENVNDKLLEAGVYDAAWHKETALRISLRRTAELCYTEKLNAANVSSMISWLRGFIRGHFSVSGAAAAGRY
ncbi:MAG: hypothetical protein A2X35_12475 [Elusimicrobia bacterium GWA2_61_42]|nr:MAG: hypothetical protein A2X35_12475 [Elusimicrobia bacterium GWA2_61_42]OGR75311.1 MAG: hypothetical protein A2X38_05920 [Elusimicrobia bacterium GWC2_61_25]